MGNAESGSGAEKLHAEAERVVGQEIPEASPENREAVEERIAEVDELHAKIDPLRVEEATRVEEGIDAARETLNGSEPEVEAAEASAADSAEEPEAEQPDEVPPSGRTPEEHEAYEPDWEQPVDADGPDFDLPEDPFANEFNDQPPRVAEQLREQANEWLTELRANIALDKVRQAEEKWSGDWTETERIAREQEALDNHLPDVTPELVEEAKRLLKEENEAFAESPLDKKLLEKAKERKFETIQGMADEYAEGRTPTLAEYDRANEAFLKLIRDGGSQPPKLDVGAEARKYAIKRYETLKDRFWKGSKLKKLAVVGVAAAAVLVPPVGAAAMFLAPYALLYEGGRGALVGARGGLKRLRHRGEKAWSDRKLRKFLGGGKAAKSVKDENRPI